MLDLSKEFSFILGHCPNGGKACFCFILGLPTWGIWATTLSYGPQDLAVVVLVLVLVLAL